MQATVKLLTAEVRTLQVGSRQVTLSVYRQLDECAFGDIEPFGRVRDKDNIGIVGADPNGVLVKHTLSPMPRRVDEACGQQFEPGDGFIHTCNGFDRRPLCDRCETTYQWSVAIWKAEIEAMRDMPLIVLAGLR